MDFTSSNTEQNAFGTSVYVIVKLLIVQIRFYI